MNLLEELEILLETRQPYANGNAEKCYPFVAELIQQLRAAQQNAHLTGGGLCAECGSPAWTHSVRDHAFVEPHHPQVA